MTARADRGPAVDIIIASPLWRAVAGVEPALRRAIAAGASPSTSNGELAIVLADDAAIRALNRQWRGRDQPTNVLSFPAGNVLRPPGVGKGRKGSKQAPRLLGDIVIAYETTAREADAEGKPFVHHLAHLAVHGFLHLFGYDHESDAEAEAMERREREILARLGIPDPYETRDSEG